MLSALSSQISFVSFPLTVLACLVGLYLLYTSIIIVGGNEISILERRYFGTDMPDGRVIAMSNEVGVQARTLGPGFHFVIPILYRCVKVPFTVIGENEIGQVESIDGNPVPPEKSSPRSSRDTTHSRTGKPS